MGWLGWLLLEHCALRLYWYAYANYTGEHVLVRSWRVEQIVLAAMRVHTHTAMHK